MVKISLVSLFLVASSPAFASGPCATASTTLTQPERKMYARSISSNLSKWQPPAQIKVQKAVTVANWTAVWATPTGMEQGVFFYSQEKSGLVFHDVWGGYAASSDKANVTQWVMKLSPSVPNDFAECFADAVTAGR